MVLGGLFLADVPLRNYSPTPPSWEVCCVGVSWEKTQSIYQLKYRISNYQHLNDRYWPATEKSTATPASLVQFSSVTSLCRHLNIQQSLSQSQAIRFMALICVSSAISGWVVS